MEIWIIILALQLVGFSVWIGKMSQNVKDNGEKIKSIGDKVDNLIEKVAKIGGRLEPYAVKESPLSLTEKGADLLEKSGAKKYIRDNKDALIEQFISTDVPLDIQENAKEIMLKEIKQNVDIKNYIFKEGEEIDNVATVAGIELRDIVFSHKNIKT